LRAAFGQRAQEVERRWVGPVQVLERDDGGLGPRSRENPGGHCRKLSASKLLRRKISGATWRWRDVDKRRDKGYVFRGVEANQPQGAFQVDEALFGRRVCAKSADPIR
jgi:hypothetical protein